MAVEDRIDLFQRSQVNNTYILSIDISRIYFYESSIEPWGLKDLNSRYIYVNKPYLDLLNIPENENIIGKTFEEAVGISDNFSDSVRMHELLVIEKRSAVYSREVLELGKNQTIAPYIFKRMPYFSDKNTVSAIEFNGIPWEKIAFMNSNLHFLRKQISTNEILKPADILTEHEWEILYLYCSGVRRKSIATKFEVKDETIKTILKTISLKLRLDSQSMLLNFVSTQGWLNHIPIRLLNELNSFIIMEL